VSQQPQAGGIAILTGKPSWERWYWFCFSAELASSRYLETWPPCALVGHIGTRYLVRNPILASLPRSESLFSLADFSSATSKLAVSLDTPISTFRWPDLEITVSFQFGR
jgi:hypothetical protein